MSVDHRAHAEGIPVEVATTGYREQLSAAVRQHTCTADPAPR